MVAYPFLPSVKPGFFLTVYDRLRRLFKFSTLFGYSSPVGYDLEAHVR